MRTIRIYQPGDYQPGDLLTLSESAAQHVGLVLRLTVGAQILLFRGDNIEFKATLYEVQKKHIKVHIDTMQSCNRESPRHIHLAQSIAKGDKMEWIIQKAVELGVTTITPLLTEHSIVRLDKQRLLKKQQQWQAIAISACEQSGRNSIPKIYPASTISDYLAQNHSGYKLILSPDVKHSWPVIDLPSDITLLIGPEGGFSQNEIEIALQYQAQCLRLGPRILRTETAAIAALSIIQMLYGDLG